MTTLEEEIIIPLQRQMAEQRTSPSRLRIWSALLISSLGFIAGIAGASLFLLKTELTSSWRQAVASYDWLVMAEGDTVAMDEVGRFLKKIDGVANVTFVSPDDVLQKASLDGDLASDLSLLESNPFPSGWVVEWQPAALVAGKIEEATHDVRTFPGVIDIATDPQALARVRTQRTFELRVTRALIFYLSAVLFMLFVGAARLLFQPRPGWLRAKVVAAGAVVALFSTMAGGALVYFAW